MHLLGVDISTTTIGLTILNEKKELVLIDYIKPNGNTFLEKALSVEQQFQEKIKIPIDKIAAEQPSMMFKQGKSSAQIIATILRFNGIVHFILYKLYNIYPQEMAASTARKLTTGVGIYKKPLNAKEECFKWLEKNVQMPSSWPVKKQGQNKGQLADEAFDMSDSYIIALAALKFV